MMRCTIEKAGVRLLLVFAIGMGLATPLGCIDVNVGIGNENGNGNENGEVIPLKEAKLIIEHNATDGDTGFQGFLDGEPWDQLVIVGAEGVVAAFEARGKVRSLGLTELFFETSEPSNAEVPIPDVLSALPEGEYAFESRTVEGMRQSGTAVLTHRIPAGPVLLSPVEGATVPTRDLVLRWSPVSTTIDGDDITIVRYQVIVEKDENPPANSIGKNGMSIYVPGSVTSMTVPNEFLEPETPYKWEVLAIEESGNQTLSSGAFSTE